MSPREAESHRMALGRIIRESRQKLNLSQYELAERCALHRSYIGEIKRGIRSISIINLSKVSFGLNLRTSWILSAAEKSLLTAAKTSAERKTIKSKLRRARKKSARRRLRTR